MEQGELKHAASWLRRWICPMTSGANVLTSHATLHDAGSRRRSSDVLPGTPCSQIKPFVDAFDRLGFDVPALLARVGVERAALDDADATFPPGTLDAILGLACQQQRLTNLGARLAAATPIGAYPLLDYLVVTTDTVHGALEQLIRYFHLANAPVRLLLVPAEHGARLLVDSPANAFVAEYETTIIVHHLGEETQRRLQPTYVSLAHTPEALTDLERLVGCPVRAPSTWTGIEFSHDSLALPLRRRDPALRGILEGHAAEVVARSSAVQTASVVGTVRAAIVSRLSQGVPSIGVVARQLAVAPRTLQRRLSAEAMSYNQLVDTVRREAAERLLTDASVAVGEVGYLLGFSEPSAFHRAFKRWHAITPQEYRRSRRVARDA